LGAFDSAKLAVKLLAKFTLLFAAVFGTGLAIAGIVSYRFLEENAKDQVLQQARLMLQAALTMRQYTSEEITPLLDTPNMRRTRFLPQTIPFYAATQGFNALRRQYHEYTYKEAAMNPSNPRDRAVDWEADIIAAFRNNQDQKESVGERDTPSGPSLFIARPIKAREECLECHGSPKKAPPGIIKAYGSANGFGWKPNEVVGAQVISVPEEIPIELAKQAFRNLMIYLGAVAAAALIVLNLALYFTVVRPVRRLSVAADEISNGNIEAPGVPVRGKDEIAGLAESFNRMHISLGKALRMLHD
jgi:HAMP domain-containing protein